MMPPTVKHEFRSLRNIKQWVKLPRCKGCSVTESFRQNPLTIGRLPPAAPLQFSRVNAASGRGYQVVGGLGAELHSLLLVQVVQDGVPVFPPHLGPSPPEQQDRQTDRRFLDTVPGQATDWQYSLAAGPDYRLRTRGGTILSPDGGISLSHAYLPLAAADECPADGQDGDG